MTAYFSCSTLGDSEASKDDFYEITAETTCNSNIVVRVETNLEYPRWEWTNQGNIKLTVTDIAANWVYTSYLNIENSSWYGELMRNDYETLLQETWSFGNHNMRMSRSVTEFFKILKHAQQ